MKKNNVLTKTLFLITLTIALSTLIFLGDFTIKFIDKVNTKPAITISNVLDPNAFFKNEFNIKIEDKIDFVEMYNKKGLNDVLALISNKDKAIDEMRKFCQDLKSIAEKNKIEFRDCEEVITTKNANISLTEVLLIEQYELYKKASDKLDKDSSFTFDESIYGISDFLKSTIESKFINNLKFESSDDVFNFAVTVTEYYYKNFPFLKAVNAEIIDKEKQRVDTIVASATLYYPIIATLLALFLFSVMCIALLKIESNLRK